MLLAPPRPLHHAALSDEAAASVARLEDDVRLSLCGIAPRRAELLARAAGRRYSAALGAATTDAWQLFAAAIRAALRASDEAPPETDSARAREARRRLRGFLAENPDLGRNRVVPGPTVS
jgi:hypothetical protein